MASDREIRCRIVRRLVRDNVTGSHKVTVDTAKRAVATSDRGRAEAVIRELVRDPSGPLEAYGGSRDNVRLASIQAGVRFLKENGCELPWGYE